MSRQTKGLFFNAVHSQIKSNTSVVHEHKSSFASILGYLNTELLAFHCFQRLNRLILQLSTAERLLLIH